MIQFIEGTTVISKQDSAVKHVPAWSRDATKMDPITLRLFVSACEGGTLAGTAEREHIAPAAVSKRIAELETTLDLKLLYRDNKGVVPTAAGIDLMRLAKKILRDLDDAYKQMRIHAIGMTGSIRLFANISAITQFLPDDLRVFLQRFPAIKLELEEHISSDVLRGVVNGDADVGIYSHAPHHLPLRVLPYRSDPLALIVPVGHVLAIRQSVGFAETLEFPYVGLHAGSAIDGLLQQAARDAGRPLKLIIRVTGFDAVCAMVRSGVGLGVVPIAWIGLHANRLGFVVIPIADRWAARELKLCVPVDKSPSPVVEKFIEHLRNV